jgi:hypothetical protein
MIDRIKEGAELFCLLSFPFLFLATLGALIHWEHERVAERIAINRARIEAVRLAECAPFRELERLGVSVNCVRGW